MKAKPCRRCGKYIAGDSAFCPYCRTDRPIRDDYSRKDYRGLAIGAASFVVVFLIILAGMYHVVSGVPGMLVRRQTFGYADMFGSIQDCTSSPWIVATSTHPRLCSDLQAAGILESDQQRQRRLLDEFRESQR